MNSVQRELIDVRSLTPYADNPRINTDAVPKVAESIRRFGFLGDIVIDSKGVIVAGHTRALACMLLLERGDCGLWGRAELNPQGPACRYQGIAPMVPVIRAEHLTEDEIRAYRIADNKTAEASRWDYDLLAKEVDLLADSDIDMSDFGLVLSPQGEVDFGNLDAMLGEKDEAYEAFVDKFKSKPKPMATTDDCFTPPEVYDAVKAWVFAEYGLPDDTEIVRPFYPGGDYQSYQYPDGCLVLDNPPFSIMREIVTFYQAHGIRFFLFGEGMSIMRSACASNIVIAGYKVRYANGVTLSTSFATSLGDDKILVSASLYDALVKAQDRESESRAEYDWPSNVISGGLLQKLPKYGISMTIHRAHPVTDVGKDRLNIYGGGALVSDADARMWADLREQAELRKVEQAERDRVAVVLTVEERAIIARLGADDGVHEA